MPREKKRVNVLEPSAIKTKTKALESIAKAFGDWRPTTEVFKPIVSMPTKFVQFDHATNVGGLPVGRIVTVSGPSNEGKTLFCLGLVASYLSTGNPAMYVDAEYTMDDEYFSLICGDYLQSPLFKAIRPSSYEEVVERTREFATKMEEFRAGGVLPKNGGSLIVIDSLKKLVPKNLLSSLLKGDGGIDGAKGRGAQIKAALNAQWLDEMVPLLDRTNTTLVLIARETEDPAATQWDRMAGNDVRVGGGKAIIYDSSLVVRVERDGYVETPYDKESKQRGVLYGERHKGSIRKTKLSSKRDRVPVFYFHSSNGVATPAGLDGARDLVHIGLRLGIIEKSGSWFQFEDHKWQGEHAAAVGVSENISIRAALEVAVRARFSKQDAPEEAVSSEDG